MSRKGQPMPVTVAPTDPDSPSARLVVVAQEVHTWADRLLQVARELEEEAARDRSARDA